MPNWTDDEGRCHWDGPGEGPHGKGCPSCDRFRKRTRKLKPAPYQPPTDGTPRVMVADPAWKFKDKLGMGKRGAVHKYASMSPHDILLGTVERNFAPHEVPDVLVLWRVAAMQREALEVIDAWGYEDPTSEIVWIKETKTGKLGFGLGRTVRASHEVALICKRKGTPGWKALDVVIDHGVRSVLEAGGEVVECMIGNNDGCYPNDPPREEWTHRDPLVLRAPQLGEHSEKPPEFYQLIDRLFRGPVVELFARRQWAGWTCCGDEMPVGHPGRVTL